MQKIDKYITFIVGTIAINLWQKIDNKIEIHFYKQWKHSSYFNI